MQLIELAVDSPCCEPLSPWLLQPLQLPALLPLWLPPPGSPHPVFGVQLALQEELEQVQLQVQVQVQAQAQVLELEP